MRTEQTVHVLPYSSLNSPREADILQGKENFSIDVFAGTDGMLGSDGQPEAQVLAENLL